MTKRQKTEKYNELKRRFGWILVFSALAILMILSIQRKQNAPLDDFKVVINDLDGKRNLITKKDIHKKFVNHLGFDLGSAVLKDLDIKALEQLLNDDPRVKSNEVFVDGRNVLNVKLEQRVPIMRVADHDGGGGYYLDNEGMKIPLRSNAAVRVALVTGELPRYKHGFAQSDKRDALRDVYDLMIKVNEDPFMLALVEQVDVSKDGYITIAPKLGRKKIRFGKYENVDQKFYKLKRFYKELLPRTGWDKHEALNLEYKDQVIAQNLEQ